MRYHKCIGDDGPVVEFGRTIRVDSTIAKIDLFRSPEKYRSAFAAVFPSFTVTGGTATAKPSKSAVAELRQLSPGDIVEQPDLMAGKTFRDLEAIAGEFSWGVLLNNLPGVIVAAADSVVTVRTASGDVKFIGDGDHTGVFPLSQVGSVSFAGKRHDMSRGFTSFLRDSVWYPPYVSTREDVKDREVSEIEYRKLAVIDTTAPVKRGEIV